MASLAGNRRRRGHRRCCRDDLARTTVRVSRGVDLPSGAAGSGRSRWDRRASRRTAGVGRELLPPVRRHVVRRKDDEQGMDRRHFLECMAWVGTGAVWTMSSGVLRGAPLGQSPRAAMMAHGSGVLRFTQISDSHIGFNKPANTDVTATLRAAIDKIKSEPDPPAFVLHTGDLTHLSRPDEFDTLQQVLSDLSVPVFYVPGEHDVLGDDGKSYLERFGKGTRGAGWHSFDRGGVHFIGLVNVVDLKAGGLGTLGRDQLEWLENDVKRLT